MRAQVINQFGDPSVFQISDIPTPILKPGHVLIKVLATSVNPIDCKIRKGLVPNLAPPFPAILQGDVSGVVLEVTDDVKNFKPGDEVYGCAGGFKDNPGALAEYMLADAQLLAKRPQTLSAREAAALPLVSITAWEALFDFAKIKPEFHVLIHGGTGGVGHIAVQLAKWCGARVATTIRHAENFELAKSLGADEVINAQEESVESYVARLTGGRGFDVVFDTVGGPNLDRALAAAKIRGTVVTTAARSTHDLSVMHGKALSLHVVFMLLPIVTGEGRAAHGKILTELAQIVDQGKLKPMIDPHTFMLEQISEAHALLESGKTHGKVVVDIQKNAANSD
ncbi:MAG: zinc-dependent alcohol dehydrogenase family protein [Gammaproteobacteria bacterium]